MSFRFHAHADVGVRAEPAHHLALRIADRNCLREEPAVVAIPAAEGECVFPELAILETSADVVHHPSHVVWVMYRLPAAAGHLLQRSARVVKPALVVPED